MAENVILLYDAIKKDRLCSRPLKISLFADIQ